MKYSFWDKILLKLAHRQYLKWIPDSVYLKMLFKTRMGRNLNLKDPKTYNEKLQWIKLYDRKPEYTVYVDKHAVKDYVASMVGEQYIIPTFKVWDNVKDIDFDSLPNQFVMKCTHDSGSLVICKDKNNLDRKAAIKRMKKGLKHSGYWHAREWPYKNVPRRIIAEQYLVDDSGFELKDYKVMCFNGEPKLIEIHRGRYTDKHIQDFYDCDWVKQPITQDYVISNDILPKPIFLDEMLELSRKLSVGIPHVRVDWYYANGQLYFGELTFFDGAGLTPFDQEEWDYTMGSWIELPPKH